MAVQVQPAGQAVGGGGTCNISTVKKKKERKKCKKALSIREMTRGHALLTSG